MSDICTERYTSRLYTFFDCVVWSIAVSVRPPYVASIWCDLWPVGAQSSWVEHSEGRRFRGMAHLGGWAMVPWVLLWNGQGYIFGHRGTLSAEWAFPKPFWSIFVNFFRAHCDLNGENWKKTSSWPYPWTCSSFRVVLWKLFLVTFNLIENYASMSMQLARCVLWKCKEKLHARKATIRRNRCSNGQWLKH